MCPFLISTNSRLEDSICWFNDIYVIFIQRWKRKRNFKNSFYVKIYKEKYKYNKLLIKQSLKLSKSYK